MRTIAVSVCLFAGLALPALAGDPYYYTLTVPNFTPPGGPTMSGWTATWQSSALLVPPSSSDIQLLTQTAFAVNGPPQPGYSVIDTPFNVNASDGYYGIVFAWNPSGSGDQILYSFYFSAATPPVTTGVFHSYRTTFECCGAAVQEGPKATLKIARPGPPPPPPPPPPAWSVAGIRFAMTIAGPVSPPPGSPVEANVAFTDLAGNAVGQPVTVSLAPGQVTTVDLAGSTVAQAGQHVNLFPSVTALAGTLLPPLEITTEVFDRQSGLGAVLSSVSGLFAPPQWLTPQTVAAGQIMRLIATAYPPNPCAGTLSFADAHGNAVGPSLSVSLNPGQSQALDLNSSVLALQSGQRVEVQPKLALQPGAACAVTSDTFDAATGRTSTYQHAVIR